MIYICSPLRANHEKTMEENVEQAKAICRHCSLQGELVMAVHLYFTQFLDDTIYEERECGLQHGLTVLKKCKEVWVFGELISGGMKAEIKLAEDLGIPIKYHPDIEEWMRGN